MSCSDITLLVIPPMYNLFERKRSISIGGSSITGSFVQRTTEDEMCNLFSVGRRLGTGSFSIVRKCRRRSNGEMVAIKMIDRTHPKVTSQMIQNEINILRRLNHNNIVKLYEAYQTIKNVYLVMELVEGRTLAEVMKDDYPSGVSESIAARIYKQVLQAVDHMHSAGVVHRDLKPENVILVAERHDDANAFSLSEQAVPASYVSTSSTRVPTAAVARSTPTNYRVAVVDFGLAKTVGHSNRMLYTICGTPYFMAPEIVRANPHRRMKPSVSVIPYNGKAVDIWSSGCILYFLLSGQLPFEGSNYNDLFRSILDVQLTFKGKQWQTVTPTAQHLIRKHIHRNPDARISAREALSHYWLSTFCSDAHSGGITRTQQRLPERRPERSSLQDQFNRIQRQAEVLSTVLDRLQNRQRQAIHRLASDINDVPLGTKAVDTTTSQPRNEEWDNIRRSNAAERRRYFSLPPRMDDAHPEHRYRHVPHTTADANDVNVDRFPALSLPAVSNTACTEEQQRPVPQEDEREALTPTSETTTVTSHGSPL